MPDEVDSARRKFADSQWHLIQDRLDDMRRVVEANRAEFKGQLDRAEEHLRADLRDMAERFAERLEDTLSGFQETQKAILDGAINAQNVKWESHTGENGDHEKLTDQRKEDIQRTQANLISFVTIVAAVLGLFETYLYLRLDGVFTYLGILLGAFVVVTIGWMLRVNRKHWIRRGGAKGGAN
jgi:hypothetical protein